MGPMIAKTDRRCVERDLMTVLMVFFVLVLSWIQMEWSAAYESPADLSGMEFRYMAVNILTDLAIFLLIYVICDAAWLACVLYSLLTSLISVADYHIIRFHGMPLSFMELKNFRAAWNVAGGYHFDLRGTWGLWALLGVELAAGYVIKRLTAKDAGATGQKSCRKRLAKTLCIGLGICLFAYPCYLSPEAVISRPVEWSWKEAYRKYGFMACTIGTAVASIDYLEEPAGYDRAYLDGIKIEEHPAHDPDADPPDIILILNETFYDMSLICDIRTDIPYMDNIDSMENIVRGYAVGPVIGGATNSSEYELLTSCSLQLMPGITPFNIIDMNGGSSIVSHLKGLGYSTMGMHSGSGTNYNRANAYREMGFDTSYFYEDIIDREYYGDRKYFETDRCLYSNLLMRLEEQGDAPRFAFLLTLQNHGGWDINPRETDIVHTLDDLGEYNECVDEYLSCIYLSDQAFKELTDRLACSDRRTVVCMVGDHCPYIAGAVVDSAHQADRELLLRAAPFVIWANYDIGEKDLGFVSMNQVVPALLETAQVRLSPFYRYLLDIREDVPVLSSYGVYFDASMTEYPYGAVTQHTQKVMDYFYMEYNALQKDKAQYLFEPYDG